MVCLNSLYDNLKPVSVTGFKYFDMNLRIVQCEIAEDIYAKVLRLPISIHLVLNSGLPSVFNRSITQITLSCPAEMVCAHCI